VEAEAMMVASLREFGQLSPVVCCERAEVACLLDGYQRLRAARELELPVLSALLLEVDDREAKAAMYRLNQLGRRIHVPAAGVVDGGRNPGGGGPAAGLEHP
jgi:ParB-like chromosome segregation protein Spo0J